MRMPPRIPQVQAICSRRAFRIDSTTAAWSSLYARAPSTLPACNERRSNNPRTLHTTADLRGKFKYPDVSRQPWVLERWARNKEARDAFREARRLEKEADAAHPVWGKETDFIKRLDKTPQTMPSLDTMVDDSAEAGEKKKIFNDLIRREPLTRLNYDMSQQFLKQCIDTARLQSYPPVSSTKAGKRTVTEKDMEDYQTLSTRATAAIHRIMSLGNGDSTDTTQANRTLCIETFGRHNTDTTLPPSNAFPDRKPKRRAGPDTGSSEVQAAILTVRIRKLAAHVGKNNKDKHNKSRLRQLCHKRQKQLRYLRRKERGGERYRNAMEMLGMDEDAIDQELFM